MMFITPVLRKSSLLTFLALCSALLLSGCLGPKTPQEVAKAFWAAVIVHDANDAAKYSSLANPQAFDGFGMDWQGYTPVWGKVIIDGDKASIETRFSGPAGSDTASRHCVTYLERKDGVWKVDYKMTGDDLHGGALGTLFGQLNQMGSELSKSVDASMQQLHGEMERLGRKLQAMSDSFSQQAGKIIDKHARELQDIMQQLKDSINRALQDDKNHLSDQDKQVMVSVAADLDNSSKNLTAPSSKSVTECNYDMGMARLRLQAIDSDVSSDYKQQWQALNKRFAAVMREMLDELASSMKDDRS